ncbi:MAG TPA: glycerophosphodiester phosphodiesterase family protein [Flavobacterium sp.]|nr:glycerophosphodiester phosphodiesterase family protein [Flavobacterium sp.]
MKYVFFILLVSINSSFAQNMKIEIIAHRGAWKEFNLPQNSIASLQKAIELKCFGSEFDVHLTKDNMVVVNHDHDFYGIDIELNDLSELQKKQHPNGETIPTLGAYFNVGLQQNTTKLILEIKTSRIGGTSRTKKMIDVIAQIFPKEVHPSNLEFILFDYESALYTKSRFPNYQVHYLNGDKTAKEIQTAGLDGMDYHYSLLIKDHTIVPSFNELNLKTNSWTVNDLTIAKQLKNQEINYLTTDYPKLFLEIF